MNINSEIIDKFFSGNDYSTHWVFSNIEPGKYLFEEPNHSIVDLQSFYTKVVNTLISFEPYNLHFFNETFSNWNDVLQGIEIILSVGAPYPYDAMVRDNNGKVVIIFDLNRMFTSDEIFAQIYIKQMITHELFHVLYRLDKNVNVTDYKDSLLNTTFDEGFAHYLANSLDFEESEDGYDRYREKYFGKNLITLRKALNEKDKSKREEYLISAVSGNFWDKFASVVGMFILYDNKTKINQIYESGYKNILSYLK